MRDLVRALRRRVVAATLGHREVARTDEAIFPADLGFESAEHNEYSVSSWRQLRAALQGERITPADILLDLGSGKGRVVVHAARRYPFGRVIGVELSPELVRVAEANVDLNRRKLRAPVVLVTEDASRYEIPDDVSHVYLFNSFSGATFATVIDNLTASVDRRPRRVVLMYSNPFEHEAVVRHGRWRVIRDHAPRFPVRVYESVPR